MSIHLALSRPIEPRTTAVGSGVQTVFSYAFEGAAFDQIGDSPLVAGSFMTGDRITGWVIMDTLLEPNLDYSTNGKDIGASVDAWVFNNSRGVITNAMATVFSWMVSTDGSGNITEWILGGGQTFGENAVGSSALGFHSSYRLDNGDGSAWGQDQADFSYWYDRTHIYGETGVSSNKPGSWRAPIEITFGTLHSDAVVGSELDSIQRGRGGDDSIFGHGGDDELLGGSGSDMLLAGNGHDRIVAGTGDDIIDGGSGDDTLFGGRGSDTFVFGFDYGFDKLRDFEVGFDSILIASGAEYLGELRFTDFNGGCKVKVGGDILIVANVSASELALNENFIF